MQVGDTKIHASADFIVSGAPVGIVQHASRK
jgi:hypothetical protein